MHTALAALLALGAALLTAVGSALRQRATAESGAVTSAWAVGAAIAGLGFALQALALAFGSVLLVQPLIVLSVLFGLPAEAVISHIRPTVTQWLLGVAVAVGVVVFVVFAEPVPARHGRQLWVLDVVVGALLLALALLVVLARRRSGSTAALLYGTAAGTLFGLLAVQVKALTEELEHPVLMLRHPTVYLFLLTAAGAIWCQQKSFAAGSLQSGYPAMVVAEPVVSMAVSLAVVGEKLSAHSLSTVVSVVGLALMVYAVLRLARLSAARTQEAEEEAAGAASAD